MKYDGYNGQIIVEDDVLVIERDGLVARAAFGKGTSPRRIPLQALSGVSMQEATRLKNGWITLGIGGAKPADLNAKTAASNGDAVMFTHKNGEQSAALHVWLRSAVERNKSAGIDPGSVDFDASGGGQSGRLDRLASAAAEKASALQNKQEGIEAVAGQAVAARAAAKEALGILFEGTSHESGRNSRVSLYADRLERVQDKKLTSISKAKQDTEVTPVRAVSSVQAKKDGMMYTKVTVYASGNDIEFRFGHDEAQRFKDALMRLVLQGPTPQPAAAPAAPDLADQLSKLASLRDQGILTEDEFAAKKADILSRM